MRQRGYIIAFVLVLLLACVGAFVGGRLLWQNIQGGTQAAGAWTPPVDIAALTPVADAAAASTPVPVAQQTGPTPPAVIRVTLTQIVIPTEVIPTPDLSTPTTDPFVSPIQPYVPLSPTLALTATVTTEPVGVEYVLANPVRHSNGDCPGNYILGHVMDANGNPLANVPLLLVDEYGNRQTSASKGGSEPGRYDFPLFGPPRKFTVSIVDASGRPISVQVEVPVGSGAAAKMSCHWVDFRKR